MMGQFQMSLQIVDSEDNKLKTNFGNFGMDI